MRNRSRSVALSLIVLAAPWTGARPGAAAPVAPKDWHDTKCNRYRAAWSDALRRSGTAGLSDGFLSAHAAFLASNCTRRSDVCPRSVEELALANAMVVVTMNFGAASTFVPFYCR